MGEPSAKFYVYLCNIDPAGQANNPFWNTEQTKYQHAGGLEAGLPVIRQHRYKETIFGARCVRMAYAVVRCLSACPSVTFVYSVKNE